MTLKDILLNSVERWPENPATGPVGGESRTYSDMLEDAAAWLLKKMKIQPRPVRSRLLLYVPMAILLYMFAWPQVTCPQ